MEKEEILWIVGLVLIVIGVITFFTGIYYIYWGTIIANAEAGLAAYGYVGASGAALVAEGVVYVIVGIVLIVVGFFLLYKYKLKK